MQSQLYVTSTIAALKCSHCLLPWAWWRFWYWDDAFQWAAFGADETYNEQLFDTSITLLSNAYSIPPWFPWLKVPDTVRVEAMLSSLCNLYIQILARSHNAILSSYYHDTLAQQVNFGRWALTLLSPNIALSSCGNTFTLRIIHSLSRHASLDILLIATSTLLNWDAPPASQTSLY